MTENESKSETVEKLNMEILTARKQLQTLQNEYSDIQQKYEQIQAKCHKHEETIGEIQTDYDSIQNKYQCLQKEYEKLENYSVQSLEDCDRVKIQNENLETEIRDLKIKVEEAQRKLLENDRYNLQREQHRLQEEQGRNSSMSPWREKTNDDLHQENCKLKEELRNLTTQFNVMQKEYEERSTELIDTLSDSETLQNEIEKLQNEIERYKISREDRPLEKDFQSLKEKLESENSKLLTENLQWKEIVDTLKKSNEEKEQMLARLEERMKSDSPVKSIENCAQFMQLADSFLEIEIALGNGNTRIFQTTETHRSTNGTRMIVGNVSNLTKGTFNELRGTIEFAISNEVHKCGSDMFDSLEMEKSTSIPNSCDSFERHPNEIQINDLIEEKSRLFEKVRDLQDTVAALRAENATLLNTLLELDKTQLTIEKPKKAVLSGWTLPAYEVLKIQLVRMCEEFQLNYTNLAGVLAYFKAELNSTHSAVDENVSLGVTLNKLGIFLIEIQQNWRSLTLSNADLKSKNMALTLKMNNLPEKALEYILSEGEFRSLRKELKKSQTNVAQKESDVTKITDLESYTNRLLLEKATFQRSLESVEKNHLNKIAHLEEQINFLSKDRIMNLPKSTISPKREKDMEHMMSENHQSKIKNMCLMDKLDSNQKLSTNEERKNRRLSSHDEGRLQSFWDSNRDVSTMTDPASADCSCSEMDKKLNEMKQKLLIRDSQVNTLSMELKTENVNLKKLIIEEESKQQDLREEIKEYKNLVVNRTNKNHCAKCAEVAKKVFVDSFVQTRDIDESECYLELLKKYEDLKIIESQDALSKGKENANYDKISSFNHQQYKVGKVVAVVIISLFLYLKR